MAIASSWSASESPAAAQCPSGSVAVPLQLALPSAHCNASTYSANMSRTPTSLAPPLVMGVRPLIANVAKPAVRKCPSMCRSVVLQCCVPWRKGVHPASTTASCAEGSSASDSIRRNSAPQKLCGLADAPRAAASWACILRRRRIDRGKAASKASRPTPWTESTTTVSASDWCPWWAAGRCRCSSRAGSSGRRTTARREAHTTLA
mmetsp:Transcript_19695/g.51256  ORF Transcript_19695/g.51256 Transcript_19695/m.51256 type:complete len:205 (+) Transcript_19695:782-1396(+)